MNTEKFEMSSVTLDAVLGYVCVKFVSYHHHCCRIPKTEYITDLGMATVARVCHATQRACNPYIRPSKYVLRAVESLNFNVPPTEENYRQLVISTVSILNRMDDEVAEHFRLRAIAMASVEETTFDAE